MGSSAKISEATTASVYRYATNWPASPTAVLTTAMNSSVAMKSGCFLKISRPNIGTSSTVVPVMNDELVTVVY